jgi:hypothetical protein
MASNDKQRPALSIHRMRMSEESEAEVARRADVYLMNALKEIKEEAELSKEIKPFMSAMKIGKLLARYLFSLRIASLTECDFRALKRR